MIVPGSIERTYRGWLPFLEEVEKHVTHVLRPYCDEQGFVFEGRIKSVESVAEKIETGRYDGWPELDDLYACTVAVPLFENEEQVLDFARSRFDCFKLTRKGSVPKPPDVFRFDSTRFIGQLRPSIPGQAGPAISIYDIRFEIQIKTLFEFAWARTTHALTYKSQLVDWRRDRLAAHLKAITEQVDFLLAGFDQAAAMLGDGISDDILDKTKLKRFFAESLEANKIPREVAPKDWTRFSDNVYRLVQVLSGRAPTGRGNRPLDRLQDAIEVLNLHFASQPIEMFPRSVSLFQYILGILASSDRFHLSAQKYAWPLSSEFLTLFPQLRLPGRVFKLE